MRISDWSSDVCSSDLLSGGRLTSASENPLAIKNRLHYRIRFRSNQLIAICNWFSEGDTPMEARQEQHATFTLERRLDRSEEHTSELQSLLRISYAVFCLKKKKKTQQQIDTKEKD